MRRARARSRARGAGRRRRACPWSPRPRRSRARRPRAVPTRAGERARTRGRRGAGRTHLECNAEVAAVGVGDLLPYLALLGPAEHDGGARALGHEAGRFEVRLLQVDVPALLADACGDEGLALARAAGVGAGLAELEDLALDEVGDDARDELDDLVVAEARERGGRAAEEEVAAEDGELVAEGGGAGGDAAAEVGAVDDVVVEEGRDVDHLDDLGEAELRGEQAGGGREGGD